MVMKMESLNGQNPPIHTIVLITKVIYIYLLTINHYCPREHNFIFLLLKRIGEYDSFQNHVFFFAICRASLDCGDMNRDEEHRL